MTTAEYDFLCHTHAFPRIDDDPLIAAQELRLINLAREHGDSFKLLFNVHYINAWGVPFFKFPVATTANEQHKNTNTMNINTTVTISFDEKAEAVLNKFAEALFMNGTRGDPAATQVREALVHQAPATEEAETPATPAPEPKKREKKAAPAPKAPEPDPLENVPTGAELAERISPLKGTNYTKQLRAYLDNDLGLSGTKLTEVTDVDDLKKIEVKIAELLEAAKGDDV